MAIPPLTMLWRHTGPHLCTRSADYASRQPHTILVSAARKPLQQNCCTQFGFKRNKLRTGVDAVLAYLERCRISEGAGATQPLALEVRPRLPVAVSVEPVVARSHLCATVAQPCNLCTQGITQSPMQLWGTDASASSHGQHGFAAGSVRRLLKRCGPGVQVYTGLLETVGGVLALALTPHCTLLPQPYATMLLHSPIIGQDDAKTQMRLSAVSDLWSGESHRVRRRLLTALLCSLVHWAHP